VPPKLLARRIGLGILTLWLVSLVVFAAVIALPGDAATAILGKEATPDRVAALREQLHLNESTISQYTHWLGGILTFDLGNSAATQQPVTQLLSDRVGNSAFLVFVAAVIAIPLSIVIGVWLAMKRDRPADHVTSTVTLVLAALPEFVIGIALILIFATGVFHILPAVSLLAPGQKAWEAPVLESEYVTMARLKGLPERQVIWRHAVPNAIVPAIQVAALQLAWMAGGVVVVEFVFQYPGIGAALVDAVGNRDMPVVQTVTMLAAGVYVALNLLADLATILVTPRLRTAGR
jgi:peptide/nickel transport system permease protein